VKIEGIIWLEDVVEKLWRKHGVEAEEVGEVFDNKPRFWFVEKGQRLEEDIYMAQGRTDAGRYLVAFFIYKQSQRALIISARDMTPSERRRHERK
jgi:uncharacterized protein